MKASELIKKVKRLANMFDDCEVLMYDGTKMHSIDEVKTCVKPDEHKVKIYVSHRETNRSKINQDTMEVE